MAPKEKAEVQSEKLLGDHTPIQSSAADKKKDDTTPTPAVDKEVTPSEDDKKKKDSSSTAKKGSTSRSATSRGGGTSRSGHTQLTDLTELSPSREGGRSMVGKRKDAAGGRKQTGNMGFKKKKKKEMRIINTKLKHLLKTQAKKNKSHPRSFGGNIMRILRSVNDSQPVDEALPPKRVSQLSMMIFDSFANDLCDKICAAAVELVKNTNKRQLGSAEVKAAMKLVLPKDMAAYCEENVQVSLASYRESTKKFQQKIAKAKGNKKVAAGSKKD